MLDMVIRNGQVITPPGALVADIGIQGESIAVVTAPGLLPTEGARVIDAAGLVVAPGGVEPHTHLAHPIMSHPEEPALTLGPEEDTRGMACGGTTSHIDFCYVRPGGDIPNAIEQRAARWKGHSHVDYTFHVTLAGALPLRVFEQIPEAIQGGFPSFKVFTTNVLPPHPRRAGNRLDFGRIHLAMEQVAAHGGIMAVHGEDEDLVQFNYERFRAEGRVAGENLHLVHTKLSELLAFRRTVALAQATGAAVYFVHTSAREGVMTVAEARAAGLPVYAETLHQYACFNAEHYRTPRGVCAHTSRPSSSPRTRRRCGTASSTTACRRWPPTNTRRISPSSSAARPSRT
jgi:dihydropyrimidinase